MRKADYILEKLQNFETLVSEAQWEHTMKPVWEHGFSAPKSTPKTHTIQFEPKEVSKSSPKITFEPEKITKTPVEKTKAIETTTAPSELKTNLKLDSSGKVLEESVPEEWRDASGKVKPEWQKLIDSALKEHKFKEKIKEKRSAAYNWQQKSPIQKLQHIFSWQTLKPIVAKGLVISTVLSGVYLYMTRKKPTATDPAIKAAVDSLDTDIPNEFPSSTNALTNVNDLIKTLPTIDMSSKAKSFTNKLVSVLTRISATLTSINSGLAADNSNELAAFSKKLESLNQDSEILKPQIPKLSKYLQSIGKKEEASKLDTVLIAVDSYADLIALSKLESSKFAVPTNTTEPF